MSSVRLLCPGTPKATACDENARATEKIAAVSIVLLIDASDATCSHRLSSGRTFCSCRVSNRRGTVRQERHHGGNGPSRRACERLRGARRGVRPAPPGLRSPRRVRWNGTGLAIVPDVAGAGDQQEAPRTSIVHRRLSRASAAGEPGGSGADGAIGRGAAEIASRGARREAAARPADLPGGAGAAREPATAASLILRLRSRGGP